MSALPTSLLWRTDTKIAGLNSSFYFVLTVSKHDETACNIGRFYHTKANS